MQVEYNYDSSMAPAALSNVAEDAKKGNALRHNCLRLFTKKILTVSIW